jgi:hypothetical protein
VNQREGDRRDNGYDHRGLGQPLCYVAEHPLRSLLTRG